MKTKTLYRDLHRKLRITSRGIGTFKEHMDVVTEYRQAFDQWNLPFQEWQSFSHVNKNQYLPWRKFSIILKRWSATDKFEY